ncbi:MAG: class II aldolase/adducin family protein [Bacteroidales bacterium]
MKKLIDISRYYGDNPAYVIAGGGNTSFKDKDRIWIKASGIPLAGIDESGFVCLSREKLGKMETKRYSDEPVAREEEVKADMKEAILSPEHLRPSVETSLHNLIGYAFVIHTHPTLVNGVMCSVKAREEVEVRFGSDALYVEYTDPGFILFKKLQQRIGDYRQRNGKSPQIVFLQNHGVFVAADTIEEIRTLYASIEDRIKLGKNLDLPPFTQSVYQSEITEAIAYYYGTRGRLTKSVRSKLVEHFSQDIDHYLKVSKPFSPDVIVYCKSQYLFLGKGMDMELVISACEQFEETNGYPPRVVVEEGGGLTAIEENLKSVETVLEVYTDLMKISYLSERFGGPHFMTPEQIRFIDNWEVEHYRRRVAKGSR